MTFRISTGKATLDVGGVTRFDTDDKLLHGASSGLNISGFQDIAALSGGNGTTVDSTTTYDLGAVTSGHTQLIGAVKFNLNNSAAALAFDRWHMVLGGSIVWVMDGEPGFASALGDNSGLRQYVGYHFDISAGRARLVRRALIAGTPFSYTVLAHRITYKLRSGNWT